MTLPQWIAHLKQQWPKLSGRIPRQHPSTWTRPLTAKTSAASLFVAGERSCPITNNFSARFILSQTREQHSAIDGHFLMDNELAMLGTQSPEWIQVADAGVFEVNGLYKRAAGQKKHSEDDVAVTAGETAKPKENAPTQQDDNYKNVQLRMLMQGEVMDVDLAALGINLKSRPADLARWENGSYTLVLEPWGLPVEGIDTIRKQRFTIFSDKHGVTGLMPYYEAFQQGNRRISTTDARSKWEWSLGPAGVHPPPRVQPFIWQQGGFSPV